MRPVRVTRRRAIVLILVFAALLEGVLAIAVLAKDDGQAKIATALPMHPVAGSFKPSDAKLETCAESRRCVEQAFGNIAYYRGPKAALDRFDAYFGDFSDPDCHRVAHAIGSATLARNQGNVAKTFAQGSSSCFSGFYHGVLERSLVGVRGYQPEALGAVARNLCDDVLENSSLWLAYQCLHGLGHGLMITTGYTLPLSLKACDRLATPWQRTSCNGGVFMENISTLYGYQSRFLRDDDPVYPCNSVAEEDKLKCYEIVTSRILRVNGGDWRNAAEVCAGVERNWVTACFRSLGRDSAGQAHEDPAEILGLCAEARDVGGEETCIEGAAGAMIGNFGTGKPAAVLCNAAIEAYRDLCFYRIGSVMSLHGRPAAERAAHCRAVTSVARYRKQCLRGGKDYLRIVYAEA